MRPMNPTGKHRPKKRHHGEGTVVHRTDKYRAKPWAAVIPYRDESGRRRTMWLSAGSRKEAEALRREEAARIRRGIVPTHETVGDFVTAWLATLEVGPGTWPTYKAHVTERIVPSLGGVALTKLTPQMVRHAVASWQGAPATRGGTLRLLRAAMRQAVTDHRIEHDPTAGIPYPRSRPHRPTVLTGAQSRHLMATVKGERFWPILVVSLGLGLRRGETLGLRVQDINWEGADDGPNGQADAAEGDGRVGRHPRLRGRVDAGTLRPSVERPGDRDGDGGARPQGGSRDVRPTWLAASGDASGRLERRPVSVTIRKSLRYIAPELRREDEGPYRLTATKTHDETTLPLPAFVADALRERLVEVAAEKRAAKVYAPNDLVFCDPTGNPIPVMRLTRWFHGALERAGLPHMRYHDLRGSCATVLMEAGVDIEIVRRILRHKDIATTLRYIGQTPESLRDAAGRIEEAMG